MYDENQNDQISPLFYHAVLVLLKNNWYSNIPLLKKQKHFPNGFHL